MPPAAWEPRQFRATSSSITAMATGRANCGPIHSDSSEPTFTP